MISTQPKAPWMSTAFILRVRVSSIRLYRFKYMWLNFFNSEISCKEREKAKEEPSKAWSKSSILCQNVLFLIQIVSRNTISNTNSLLKNYPKYKYYLVLFGVRLLWSCRVVKREVGQSRWTLLRQKHGFLLCSVAVTS